MNKKLYIILGPTSSGKTSLSIDLCKKFNGQIISADSRQLFKYMDIGTGKVPINSPYSIVKKDQVWTFDNVNIWGYDLIKPGEYYSGYDFAMYALNKAQQLMDKGITVFLVGGTGFYIDIFTKRVIPSNIIPDFELRKKLNTLNLTELQEYYKSIMSLNVNDEKINIDLKNPVRIIRAIEKLQNSKKTTTPLPYLNNVDYEFIGLKSDNKFLYDKADLWVDQIWDNGLLEEVKNLVSKGYLNTPQLNGLVYKTVVSYLYENTIKNQDEAKQLIKYDIHHYIKRQLTYFKKNNNIKWFDISSGDYKKNIYNLING